MLPDGRKELPAHTRHAEPILQEDSYSQTTSKPLYVRQQLRQHGRWTGKQVP